MDLKGKWLAMSPSGFNEKFWQGKRVLVTGHTGFKGAWLCEWLLLAGARVTGISLPPESLPNLFSTLYLEKRLSSHFQDIRNLCEFEKIAVYAEPEVIFHLAAQALVRPSYQDPVGTYATNVMGTVHCLEIARQVGSVKAALIVTSDKCYENREWDRGYVESDAMGGYDPYSNSKGCAELVTSAYRNSFLKSHQVAVASARAGNVIGGGDWSKDRLIPDLISSFQQGKPALIRQPNSTRPWQHVLEPVHGYLMLAQELLGSRSEKFQSGWNFGPDVNEVCLVSQIVSEMAKLWGPTAEWKLDAQNHPHEAKRLQLDCRKAKEELRWRPLWDVKRSLKETVSWYRSFADSADKAQALTRRQIEAYSAEWRQAARP